ncbi:MAG: fructose bisphosphate aldolase [Gammaproteobacteria bacterium]|nr:fructose bisphosphate aldolase [Gammaproteobacteria bacterium]MYK43761.1 fructose bisphosphate aldolase [Gammaproteobacteria bacterium]
MDERIQLMKSGSGFIAALDQSGGSTPKTLQNYGVSSLEYGDNEELMFDLVHQMRVRIMTNSVFARPNVLGAILFEKTMHGNVGAKCGSQYLWQDKSILPFLKIDVGLEPVLNGVQFMKPIPNLSARLEEAKSLDVFGTKMRSVIKENDAVAIREIVDQQFKFARSILEHGLIPIVEPEIDIHIDEKLPAEEVLRECLRNSLEGLQGEETVVFKLTLPEQKNFYHEFTNHPRVLRVAALSGGYNQNESISRLSENDQMIASFSRALTENLRRDLTEEKFSTQLSQAIQGISSASASG